MSNGSKATDELIRQVAEATGEAVCEKLEALMRECCNCLPNYYKAMQELLRKYKPLKALAEAGDEYMVLREHDKSITVAPPPGGVARDAIDAREEKIEQKRENYARTMTQFDRLERIVELCRPRPEFLTVRLYDFGENLDGTPREPGPYTFDDMEAELEDAGQPIPRKKLQKWHSGIIRDMVVLMWGVNGAASLQLPRRLHTGLRERKPY